MMRTITPFRKTVRKFGSLFAQLTIAPSIVFFTYSLIFSLFHLTAFPWELMIILIPSLLFSSWPWSLAITVLTWSISKASTQFNYAWFYIVSFGSAIYMLFQIDFLPSAEQSNEVGFTGLTLWDPAGAIGILVAGLVPLYILVRAYQNSNNTK